MCRADLPTKQTKQKLSRLGSRSRGTEILASFRAYLAVALAKADV